MSRQPIQFRIDRRGEGDELWLLVSGELDMATAPELADELERSLDERPAALVVDLQRVSFIDSSGLHALAQGQHAADKSNTKILLQRPSSEFIKVLEVAGMLDLFTIRS